MEKKIIDGKEWVCYSDEEKQQMKQLVEKAKQGKLSDADLENLAGGDNCTGSLIQF